MNRTRFAVAALVAGAFAAVALGQNADKNSAGPTKNDYRLRVVEPAQGGVISGPTVRVVVNTEIPAEAGDTRRDVNSMPRPDVDVFLDNDLKGTMKDAQNVIEIDAVSPGPHELVLLAKNRANEIIDRKSIQFSSTASAAATTTTDTTATTTTSRDGAWALTQPAAPARDTATTHEGDSARMAPIASTSSSSSSSAYSPSTPPSTMVAAASPVQNPPPAPRSESPRPRTLPATASSNPAILLAGASLLLAGLVTRRFA